MNKEEAIQVLTKRIERLEQVRTVRDFTKWQTSTISSLEIICPKNSLIEGVMDLDAWNDFESFNEEVVFEAKELIEDLMDTIETVGIEALIGVSSKTDSEINLNVHQYNEQKTSVQISLELFVEAITHELKGSQVKELNEILKSDLDDSSKKKSFASKIKSFGSDVASNIVASVLTSPEVFKKIGDIF